MAGSKCKGFDLDSQGFELMEVFIFIFIHVFIFKEVKCSLM
jgi:hypothetical protein